MTRVKICGIRRAEDALVCAQAGADFIGLVFVPERRRRLEVAAAAEIVGSLRAAQSPSLPSLPRAVGLFADQPLEEVNRTIRECGLAMAQLCGQESPDYCQRVQGDTGAGVIKVLHVPGGTDADQAEDDLEARLLRYREAGCYITLDRLVAGLQGGTGESFDWQVATRLSGKGYEFLLAGGLTPENVARAVAQAEPWGVDVSSGVETAGEQDAGKIWAFIRNARNQSVD